MSGKRRSGEFKKAQYYVWYLGWKEVRGVWGREFTEPITRELITRRRGEDLPKLTVEITRKELKIVQLIEKKKGKIDKLKYPAIPAKDVTYAVQALSPSEDVVSCIYLGFNPTTRCAVHVHVYRCDSPETAELFCAHMNQLVEIPEHQQRIWKIEADLVAKGQIVPRPSAFVGPAPSEAASTLADNFDDESSFDQRYDDRYRNQDRFPDEHGLYDNRAVNRERGRSGRDRTPSPEPDVPVVPFEDIYDSVTAELKAKLLGKETAGPILLPPKDYDTIHRKSGILLTAENRKSQNIHIVGPQGSIIKVKKDSSGDDSARGDSEEGSTHKEDSNRLSATWGQEESRSRGGSSKGGSGKGSRPGSHHDNSRPSSYHSNQPTSLNDQENDVEAELLAITPRWKVTNQHFIPPNSPRSASPNPYVPGPGRGAPRPMSPPPELRNSYFPKGNDLLPGYLPGEAYAHQGGPPPMGRSPGLTRARAGSGQGPDGGSKKYTASTLGLTRGGGGGGSGRIRDEGYLSMDRRDPRVKSAAGYIDDPYADFGRPPREGIDIANSMPAMHGRGRPPYGDPLPDYSMRGAPF